MTKIDAKRKSSPKKAGKKISRRNYLITLALVIGIILVTVYGFQWYKIYNQEKLAKSYLISSNTITHEIKNIQELTSVLTETPDEYFIYIGYTGDKDVYDLEYNLKKIIKDYKLQDKIYYFNITDLKTKKDYLTQINQTLALDVTISTVPTIIYFQNGQMVSDGIVVREDDKVIEAADFVQLLDKFEFEKQK